MKRVFFALSFILISILAFSQSRRVPRSTGEAQRLSGYDINKEEESEDVQTRFINQQWSDADIAFKTPIQTVNLPLIFDEYNNTPYFLRNGQIMEFSAPVREFTMQVPSKKGNSPVTFRSTYPAIGKNSEETFYQVLSDGNFQLLKCRAKTNGLYKETDTVEEKNFMKEVLYAYLPNKKMVIVKKDKDQIISQMPEYASAIRKIIDSEKLKLKNESALIKLFSLLNTSN